MWSAIIASVATIGAVLYMQGPIIALGLTAASSLALLLAMRIGERKTSSVPKLGIVSGRNDTQKEDIDLLFPPLKQQAS